MEPLLIVLLVVGVFAAIVFSAAHRKKADEAWSEAAHVLGLRAKPGSMFKGRGLTGQYQGVRVHVYTFTRSTGKSSQSYTAYRIRYPSLDLGLKLRTQGGFFGMAKWFGAQDHRVGDEIFDENVVVQGSSRSEIRDFLTPVRRTKILRTLRQYKGCKIGDGEISWNATGTETSSDRIVANVRRLCELAQVLTEEKSDTPLGRGLEAQRQGRLGDALEHARAAVRETEDPHARVMAGEILMASGNYAEAAEVLEPAVVELEGDEEVSGLAAEARRRLDPVLAKLHVEPVVREVEVEPMLEELEEPAAPTPVEEPPAPAVEAELAEPEPAPTGGADSVDLEALCADLFTSGRMSFETTRAFEEGYSGRPVSWSGELERAEHYYSDLAFGSDPGTRAIFVIHAIHDEAYGDREVKAVVQLPEELLADLKERRGERFDFSGVLVRCDAFMRNLFVAEGKLAGG